MAMIIFHPYRQIGPRLNCRHCHRKFQKKECFSTDAAVAAVVLTCPDRLIFLHTAEGLPREDARGSAEETRPPTGGTLCYPAHSAAITASVLSPSCRGLSQPQQEEKEFRSGRRLEQSNYFLLYQIGHKDWHSLNAVLYLTCFSSFLFVRSLHDEYYVTQVSHPGLQRFLGQSLSSQPQSSVPPHPPKPAFWNPLHKNNGAPWQPQTSYRKNPPSQQELQVRTVRNL